MCPLTRPLFCRPGPVSDAKVVVESGPDYKAGGCKFLSVQCPWQNLCQGMSGFSIWVAPPANLLDNLCADLPQSFAVIEAGDPWRPLVSYRSGEVIEVQTTPFWMRG